MSLTQYQRGYLQALRDVVMKLARSKDCVVTLNDLKTLREDFADQDYQNMELTRSYRRISIIKNNITIFDYFYSTYGKSPRWDKLMPKYPMLKELVKSSKIELDYAIGVTNHREVIQPLWNAYLKLTQRSKSVK
jgi:vacuolar-type H+-ATPase catalytic subunit A/Vma1